jgi:RimJ/RimL family protein N-acetyltransferase
LLEGKSVNLRVAERDDIDFLVEYTNDIDIEGKYIPIEQTSKLEWIEAFDNPSNFTEGKMFIIQKKDGTRIGLINHRLNKPYKWMEIAYGLNPNERGRGYGTEAVQLVVDYLFLSKDLARIQAIVDVRNKASQSFRKGRFPERGNNSKMPFQQRRTERLLSLQHPQGRVERTKNTDKNREEVERFCLLLTYRATIELHF